MKVLVLIFVLVSSSNAVAAYQCKGVLSSTDMHAISAILHYGPLTAGESWRDLYKPLTPSAAAALKDNSRIAVSKSLDENSARLLKDLLRARASESVPGWIGAAGALSPKVWIGLTLGLFTSVYETNISSNVRIASELAGLVSAGGKLYVSESVGQHEGADKYFYTYVYEAELNNRVEMHILRSCVADIRNPK